jgi:hypothetical protein
LQAAQFLEDEETQRDVAAAYRDLVRHTMANRDGWETEAGLKLTAALLAAPEPLAVAALGASARLHPPARVAA